MTLTKGEFEKMLLDELPKMRNFALGMTRNMDHAEDLVQDAAEKMLKFCNGFQPGTNFSAWAYTVLRNAFVDRKRLDVLEKRDWRKTVSLDDLSTAPMAHNNRIDGRRQDRVIGLKDAFKKLPRNERLVLTMAGLGYDYEEMAASMKVSVGTAKSRVSRARDHMERLEKGEES